MKYLAPTPWTFGLEQSHWTNSISILDAEGAEVAVTTRGYECKQYPDGEWEGCPSYTNARLLAAAPDLLECLKEYVRDFGDNEDSDSQLMAKKAQAAIAKAEGA